MADTEKSTDGPSPTDQRAYDVSLLPDYDQDFIQEDSITAFANALAAPDTSPSQDDLTSPGPAPSHSLFITALNDWRPIKQKVRRKTRRIPRRGKDETREGYVYTLLKWPLLLTVLCWIIVLSVFYFLTRVYIFLYEHWITWRGRRNRLRQALREKTSYQDWIKAATQLDAYLGNDRWKTTDAYAYYDNKTIKRVRDHMARYRRHAEDDEHSILQSNAAVGHRPIDELRALVEASVINNFVGFENPRLYSETYYGTKELVQSFVDGAEASLRLLNNTHQLDMPSKRSLFKHLQTNFGRTALCLSGGATFSYYHFGVAKALLDANLLPQVIAGTSGGAVVAALLATRTDAELKKLLVPALAHRITACHDPTLVWLKRWWRTGARFDAVDWARRCCWFTRGDTTFREAFQRTGRILNITCVPSDPHTPTILANYLTSPDCVIWSAVLASTAVPGILNPVVLMKKKSNGSLEPYSFGHKFKDGSLRTDIPLKALNLHFNVNFSIVSQTNPHINLFFFSPRGAVGRPASHRKGRGWRGGFLGSSLEQYLKLDLMKWLKVLRHLELLPRPLGQDWSQLWLQRFDGTITIWPKSIPSDFLYILADPTPSRLARMIRVGQMSTWPKLKFIENRMKVERLIDKGRRATRPVRPSAPLNILSDDEISKLLKETKPTNCGIRRSKSSKEMHPYSLPSGTRTPGRIKPLPELPMQPSSGSQSPTLSSRLRGWLSRNKGANRLPGTGEVYPQEKAQSLRESSHRRRRSSMLDELGRQSSVFFDDGDDDFDDDDDDDDWDSDTPEEEPANGAGIIIDHGNGLHDSPEKLDGEEESHAVDEEVEEELLKTAGPTVVG